LVADIQRTVQDYAREGEDLGIQMEAMRQEQEQDRDEVLEKLAALQATVTALQEDRAQQRSTIVDLSTDQLTTIKKTITAHCEAFCSGILHAQAQNMVKTGGQSNAGEDSLSNPHAIGRNLSHSSRHLKVETVIKQLTGKIQMELPGKLAEALATNFGHNGMTESSALTAFEASRAVKEETHNLVATLHQVMFSTHHGVPVGDASAGETLLGPAMLGNLFNHLTKLIVECLRAVQSISTDVKAQLSICAYAQHPEKVLHTKNVTVSDLSPLEDVKWGEIIPLLESGFHIYVRCMQRELDAVLTRSAKQAQSRLHNAVRSPRRPAGEFGTKRKGDATEDRRDPRAQKLDKDLRIMTSRFSPWPAHGSAVEQARWLGRKACRAVAEGRTCERGSSCKFFHAFEKIGMDVATVKRAMEEAQGDRTMRSQA
jgi:hypothetical protein